MQNVALVKCKMHNLAKINAVKATLMQLKAKYKNVKKKLFMYTHIIQNVELL